MEPYAICGKPDLNQVALGGVYVCANVSENPDRSLICKGNDIARRPCTCNALESSTVGSKRKGSAGSTGNWQRDERIQSQHPHQSNGHDQTP